MSVTFVRRRTAVAFGTACLFSNVYAVPIFSGLGDLPGGSTFSTASAVSNNGVVVGSSSSSNGTEAFRWTAASGMVGLGDIAGGTFRSEATDVSADGGTIVGFGSGPSQGGFFSNSDSFRWTESVGLVPLNLATSNRAVIPNSVSGDGSTIAGTVRVDPGLPVAFRWTESAGLNSLSPALLEGFAISTDGSTIVGGDGVYRWREPTGVVSLGFQGNARAVSGDGAVVVGESPSTNGAFRWTESNNGPTSLGFTRANGVSDDGNVVVGVGPGVSSSRAFLWESETGSRALDSVLVQDFGLDLTGWALGTANAISADGTTIVGTGIHNGNTEGWIASGLTVNGAPSPRTVVYEQPATFPPTLFGTSLTSDESGRFQTFDNFTLNTNSTIDGASWQFGYLQVPPSQVPTFSDTTEWEISIWSDDSGRPGEKIFFETFPTSASRETFVGVGTTNFQGPVPVNLYDYEVSFSQPFNAAADTQYWISPLSKSAGSNGIVSIWTPGREGDGTTTQRFLNDGSESVVASDQAFSLFGEVSRPLPVTPGFEDILRGSVSVFVGHGAQGWDDFRDRFGIVEKYADDVTGVGDYVGITPREIAEVQLTSGIGATFVPSDGSSIATAATLGGYDHFNWIQLVDRDWTPVRNAAGEFDPPDFSGCVLVGGAFDESCLDPALGGNPGGWATFFDLPPGSSYRDSLPGYLDEVFTAEGLPATAGRKTKLEAWTHSDSLLLFSDSPFQPDPVAFQTCLAGVYGSDVPSVGEVLANEGTCFWWYFDPLSIVDELPPPGASEDFPISLTQRNGADIFFGGFLDADQLSPESLAGLSSLGFSLRPSNSNVPEPSTTMMFVMGVLILIVGRSGLRTS